MYDHIDKLLKQYEVERGIALAWTGRAFDKYLVCEVKETKEGSGKDRKTIRKYKYVSVKNEEYLEKTYGYNPLTILF